MQYDPNIENAEYAVCEPQVRTGLMRRAKCYDNLYLLFRTRYFDLTGSSRYLVTGFYKIDKEFGKTSIREAPIVRAKDMHFVAVNDCIDITKILKDRRAFRCCFTSNNPEWNQMLVNWTEELKKKPNRTDEYIRTINRLKNIYRENEFQDKQYPMCVTCKYFTSSNQICQLTWRRRHHTVPRHPANFMTSLSEFFSSLAENDQGVQEQEIT